MASKVKEMGGKSVSFLQDFKAFAMKGNVVDMAVGVIIGGAFGKIVTALVNDVVMPLIGLAVGGINFKELKWVIREAYVNEAGQEIAAATMNYGNFLQVTLDFIIIALSIFMVIRLIGKMNRKKEAEEAAPAPEPEPAPAPEPEPTKEELLLTEIRDLLKDKK